MSDFLEPIGNEEAILQNILGANNELLPPMSRNEKILLDILGEDYPIEPPMSRMEALLIALKEKIEHDTPSGKINITENGNDIDIAQYATADVNVSSADLGTKSITANGTYTAASDNLDGYSEVTVNVPMPDEYCIGGALIDKTLTGYHYPANPTSVRFFDRQFDGCTNLETIENFPQSITSIGANLFRNCSKLKAIELSDSITTIYNDAFFGCTALQLTQLPPNLTMLNYSALRQCESITISEIPVGITRLTTAVLYQCTSITRLKMLGDITQIDSHALRDCINCLVYDFTNNTAVPNLTSTDVFIGINANCKIVVPDSLYNDWVGATNWINYDTYIVKESEYVA